MNRFRVSVRHALLGAAALLVAACGDGGATKVDDGHGHASATPTADHDHAPATNDAAAPATPVAKDEHAGHDHAEGDGHDHADGNAHEGDGHADEHDHGPTTQLGEQVVGAYTVKASRDGGLVAGKDAPIDVWVTGAAVSKVRFWIGSEDAAGSIKAKAEIERDNWHTHAEVPDPLPAGSRLWVELEAADGAKTLVGFDLKAG